MSKEKENSPFLIEAIKSRSENSHTAISLAASQLRDFHYRGILEPSKLLAITKLIEVTAYCLVNEHKVSAELLKSFPVRLHFVLSRGPVATFEMTYKINKEEGTHIFLIGEDADMTALGDHLAFALAAELYSRG